MAWGSGLGGLFGLAAAVAIAAGLGWLWRWWRQPRDAGVDRRWGEAVAGPSAAPRRTTDPLAAIPLVDTLGAELARMAADDASRAGRTVVGAGGRWTALLLSLLAMLLLLIAWNLLVAPAPWHLVSPAEAAIARLSQQGESATDVSGINDAAHELLHAGQLAAARPLIARAVVVAPGDPEARVHHALLLSEHADPAALALCDEALRSDPELLEGWQLCLDIARRFGDRARTAAWNTELVSRMPGVPRPEDNLPGIDPEAGARGARVVWQVRCAGCHGDGGRRRGRYAGKAVLPNLASSEWQAATSDNVLRRLLMTKPVAGLSHAQLEALVDLVRGLGAGGDR